MVCGTLFNFTTFLLNLVISQSNFKALIRMIYFL